jgi:replicative DNA helicase
MSELVSQRESVKKSHSRYNESLTRATGLYGISTGDHTLNMVSGGHVPTKITTFAGRSGSSGKTATLIALGKAAGEVVNGRRAEILCNSWELSSDFLIDRAVCYEVGITLSQLRYPSTLNKETKEAIESAYERVAKWPIHYHHKSSSIEECKRVMDNFLKEIRRKESMEGVKIQPVMALDFIGRIKDSSQYRGSKTYSIEHFMMELKQYNNETGFCSYILAQILRSADSKEFPELEDIKDSSAIEENSDNLIIAHRPEYYGKETIKNPRTGEVMPSRNRILKRIVKCRESFPQDVVDHVDMKYFRFWADGFSWDYDYNELYSNEDFWKNVL